MAQNSLLSPRGFSVLLRSVSPLSLCATLFFFFFFKAEHTECRFTNNTDHLKLPNLFHILTKEITSCSLRKGALYHLTLRLTQPGNNLWSLLLSHPVTWGGGEGREGVSKYNNNHRKFQKLASQSGLLSQSGSTFSRGGMRRTGMSREQYS